MAVPEALISAALRLMHPGQFENAVKARIRTMNDSLIREKLPARNNWPTVFTGISVMTNRTAPMHRDEKGENLGYDSLLNIGTAHDAELKLADLGAQLSYGPGALVALAGRILRHEVLKWGPGDRICYAHWTRRRVFDKFSLQGSEWPMAAKSWREIENLVAGQINGAE